MAKNRTRETLQRNAEVTKSGIKARGDPVKGKQTLVTVKSTPVGKFKKRLINSCITVLATGNAIGLALNWTPDLVHVAYPLLGVTITALLTTFLTKME